MPRIGQNWLNGVEYGIETLSEHPSVDSEDRFRLVVESVPNGIIVVDKSGKIVLVNQRAEQIFNYTREEFQELGIEDLVPISHRASHSGLRESFHGKPESRAMGAGRDLFARRKGGSEFPAEIALTPLPGEDGMLILASVVDITERKNAEEKIEFQAQILNNVHDAVFFVNTEGVVRDWNEGAARVFGMDARDAVGRTLMEICPHHHGNDPFTDRILPAVKQQGWSEVVIRCRPAGGDEVFIRAKVSPMRGSGEEEGFVFCASDITEQKKLEAEILRISEEEQRRIGQDIHDDLCSQLSGIGCLTKVLEKHLQENHEQEAEMMANITEMVAKAGVRAREIAKGMVPAALETQGLPDAIEELADRSRKMFGVNCKATVRNYGQLAEVNQDTCVQLYRIAQEAVTNAVKHSDADLIEVDLSRKNGEVKLCIRDDGKGMPGDLVSAGMGLLTMRRRAEIIQADLDIHASPGSGTTITCSVGVVDS